MISTIRQDFHPWFFPSKVHKKKEELSLCSIRIPRT
jgi:hypothetical protein